MRLDQKYKSLFDKNGVNTPLRIAHFLAQINHESAGFKYLTELGGKSYFDKYEGRKDLGNTFGGDGYKYRGRGYIQITGRANYAELSKSVGIDFINNPDQLATEANGIVSAIWFWNKKGLNAYADKDDITTITKKINGGLNGFEDRKRLLSMYKKELL
jgi:putative chitinase